VRTRAGVLALQGSAGPHLACVERLGAAPREVRRREDLAGLTHLVLPGGESTTLHHLMVLFGLWEAIGEEIAGGHLACLGTCAGAILLGRGDGERPPRWGFLDVVVHRNAYGRQVDSFVASVEIPSLGRPFRGVFIRAPRFESPGVDVEVLGRREGEPVLLRSEGLLAASFHPELAQDDRVHRLFLEVTASPLEGPREAPPSPPGH
jgi:5'-phosphate synthase pdxT subunit